MRLGGVRRNSNDSSSSDESGDDDSSGDGGSGGGVGSGTGRGGGSSSATCTGDYVTSCHVGGAHGLNRYIDRRALNHIDVIQAVLILGWVMLVHWSAMFVHLRRSIAMMFGQNLKALCNARRILSIKTGAHESSRLMVGGSSTPLMLIYPKPMVYRG
mmetsp:Transcript_22586/g.61117  ORF Transcript_22586/g.61117 Transcript_22586/m.61117 type:complete len:157 (+) Transcript_22586:2373-2843(+)